MMKKKLLLVVLLCLSMFLMMPTIQADMGPKPTISLEIVGIEGSYAIDLLQDYGEASVETLTEEQITSQIEYDYYLDTYPEILNGYQDEDGFVSYTLYSGIPHRVSRDETNADLYHFGYFSPPDTFKIIVVKDSGEVFVSQIVHKQLFDAYITFDMSDFSATNALSQTYQGTIIYYDVGTVQENLYIGQTLLQFITTLLVTMIVEGLLLFVFGYRKKHSYVCFLYTNLTTQILLYGILAFSFLRVGFFGYFGLLILGEIIVFTTEILIYRKWLNEKDKRTAIIYALAANLLSMVIGLAWIFPMFA